MAFFQFFETSSKFSPALVRFSIKEGSNTCYTHFLLWLK